MNDLERQAAQRAAGKKWRIAHRAEISEYNSAYHTLHADTIREKRKEPDILRHADYNEKNREVLSVKGRTYRFTLNGKYATSRAGARSRNLPWDLTLEEFTSFWQKPCAYCSHDIETIGLDRIDNALGYSLENVRPCCSVCNYVRGNEFTPEEMKDIMGPAVRAVKEQRAATL